jgi:hypothetical protein
MNTDEMEEPKYWGFYSDDGEKLNPDLYPKPQLCLSCKKNDEGGEEEILCTLNRLDQRNSKEEFKCYVYERIKKSNA